MTNYEIIKTIIRQKLSLKSILPRYICLVGSASSTKTKYLVSTYVCNGYGVIPKDVSPVILCITSRWLVKTNVFF